MTCDSEPNGEDKQGPLGNPITGGAVLWNNWLQSTEGLLALGSSYFLIHYLQICSNKTKTFGGNNLTSTENLSLTASQNCRKKHNSLPHISLTIWYQPRRRRMGQFSKFPTPLGTPTPPHHFGPGCCTRKTQPRKIPAWSPTSIKEVPKTTSIIIYIFVILYTYLSHYIHIHIILYVSYYHYVYIITNNYDTSSNAFRSSHLFWLLVDIQNASSAGARSARAGQITSSTVRWHSSTFSDWGFKLDFFGGKLLNQPPWNIYKCTQLVVLQSCYYLILLQMNWSCSIL